jgi:hypothetical protein
MKPKSSPTQQYIKQSGLQPLLAVLANEAASKPLLPPAAVIENYFVVQKRKAGLNSIECELGVGSSPPGSASLGITVSSSLGTWSGHTALRSVFLGSKEWNEAETIAKHFAAELGIKLKGENPVNQEEADKLILLATASHASIKGVSADSKLLPTVRKALRIATSLAIARAGAFHSEESFVHHISKMAGPWAEPRRKGMHATIPDLRFTVVSNSGAADHWFPFRSIQLRCSLTNAHVNSSRQSILAMMQACVSLRKSFPGDLNPDRTLVPNNAPSNRWETLESVIKPVHEICSQSSAPVQIVLDIGADEKNLYVSVDKVKEEISSAANENAVFIAANPKAKAPVPKPKPAPPKGAPPPDPKTFWSTDPMSLTISDEAGKPLYIVAKPSPEAIAEATAANAAWPGGVPGPIGRMAVSLPRYAHMMADAMSQYSSISSVVDPVAANDLEGLTFIKSKLHSTHRIFSSAASETFGAALASGKSIQDASAAALQVPHIKGVGVIANPFEVCDTLSDAMALCHAVAFEKSDLLALAHSGLVGDLDGAEADLARAIGANEIAFGSPADSPAATAMIDRLVVLQRQEQHEQQVGKK